MDERLTYHPVTRAVAVGLRRRCGWAKGRPRRVVVAVSGGADSVALLRVMRLLAGRRGWPIELAVGHVQHHLRGEAGEADARWVGELCGALGVRYERADVAVGEGNVEAAARAARYRALREIAGRVRASEVLTAHTATDQWETLLMRVSRGTGLGGLRGIAWRSLLDAVEGAEGGRAAGSLAVLRPMLGVSRDDVRELLTSIGQGWREDETNADAERRARARLRRDVLPVLRELYPGAEHAAGRLAEIAAAWRPDATPDVTWGEVDGRWVTSRAAFDAAEMDERRAVETIRWGLEHAGVPMGRVNAAVLGSIARALRDGAGGTRRFQLAGGWSVEVTRDAVAITPRVE
ncbi:MAG: tRNA lysidine(34) synthetase TilS [Planctomycetota bacterium]